MPIKKTLVQKTIKLAITATAAWLLKIYNEKLKFSDMAKLYSSWIESVEAYLNSIINLEELKLLKIKSELEGFNKHFAILNTKTPDLTSPRTSSSGFSIFPTAFKTLIELFTTLESAEKIAKDQFLSQKQYQLSVLARYLQQPGIRDHVELQKMQSLSYHALLIDLFQILPSPQYNALKSVLVLASRLSDNDYGMPNLIAIQHAIRIYCIISDDETTLLKELKSFFKRHVPNNLVDLQKLREKYLSSQIPPTTEAFLAAIRKLLKDVRKKYPYLENYCLIKNSFEQSAYEQSTYGRMYKQEFKRLFYLLWFVYDEHSIFNSDQIEPINSTIENWIQQMQPSNWRDITLEDRDINKTKLTLDCFMRLLINIIAATHENPQYLSTLDNFIVSNLSITSKTTEAENKQKTEGAELQGISDTEMITKLANLYDLVNKFYSLFLSMPLPNNLSKRAPTAPEITICRVEHIFYKLCDYTIASFSLLDKEKSSALYQNIWAYITHCRKNTSPDNTATAIQNSLDVFLLQVADTFFNALLQKNLTPVSITLSTKPIQCNETEQKQKVDSTEAIKNLWGTQIEIYLDAAKTNINNSIFLQAFLNLHAAKMLIEQYGWHIKTIEEQPRAEKPSVKDLKKLYSTMVEKTNTLLQVVSSKFGLSSLPPSLYNLTEKQTLVPISIPVTPVPPSPFESSNNILMQPSPPPNHTPPPPPSSTTSSFTTVLSDLSNPSSRRTLFSSEPPASPANPSIHLDLSSTAPAPSFTANSAVLLLPPKLKSLQEQPITSTRAHASPAPSIFPPTNMPLQSHTQPSPIKPASHTYTPVSTPQKNKIAKPSQAAKKNLPPVPQFFSPTGNQNTNQNPNANPTTLRSPPPIKLPEGASDISTLKKKLGLK